ncbi:MAG: hypothetical protein F2763_00305 [Actinobacteria bacterium]|uniref:Unannotated protein n=1 Tax=freshwater metagenome TaxID=449393 RepID=A0A6J6ZIH5_9ZZZZ|nr:hypothetical protein [Actinomycetota bacterium]
MASVLRAIARVRFLRETPFDDFGYASVRRVERALAAEYRTMVARLAAEFGVDNYDRVVSAAATAEMVRGYDNVKRPTSRSFVRLCSPSNQQRPNATLARPQVPTAPCDDGRCWFPQSPALETGTATSDSAATGH